MDPDYPTHTPPVPQPPPYYPPPPQVVTKPGGLSSTAHAVHIVACVLTCGLWIPGYVLFIAFAPSRRTEVIVPYGADPVAVQAAYAAAAPAAPTAQERKSHNLTVLLVFGVCVATIVLCLAFVR